jgi:pyruvate/2-oxoglutarate dehydrogenase complex dihydrolipoamide dehydrogenase (E3) component
MEVIESDNPDVIFLATGSIPAVGTGIKGTEQVRWTTPDGIYEGNVPSGKNVCVVGGGSVGCETALYLAYKGYSVTVLEMAGQVSADLHEANKEMLLELLRQHKVEVRTGMKVEEMTRETVICSAKGGSESFSADFVVLAVGRQPVRDLFDSVRNIAKEVYMVGDCVEPGKIKDAIWEAFKLAITV